MIQKNNQRYENSKRKFIFANIIEDPLPCVDMILCRDGLVHLSLADGIKAIKNFKKSGSMYLLATTFVNHFENRETVSPLWRELNLQIEPFAFPEPLIVINEEYRYESYADKSLGLWRLKDISL